MKTTTKPLTEKLHSNSLRGMIACFVLALTLSSCMEYTSHYPIGKPKERTIKSKLLGDWTYLSAVNRNTKKDVEYGAHFMRISPFNEKEYLIQIVSDTVENLQDIDLFRGFTTTISDRKLANISPIRTDQKRPVFSIYEYRLEGDSLIFHGISQDTFDTLNVVINSIGQHKKFIKTNLDNEVLWDMEYKYLRKKQ